MPAFQSRAIALLLVICALLSIPDRACANDLDFQTWVAGVKSEAAAQGIRPGTIDAAFAGVQPIPRVLELDRKQPESTMTFAQYIDRVLPAPRVELARQKMLENQTLLAEITARYGVPPQILVALWGVESGFGQNIGSYSVIGSLSTLAYDGRRSSYFRKELLSALLILDQGNVTPSGMLGSWAGAMGQPQFMPSSFLTYAVDFKGTGRKDIWTNRADVLASIANYIARSGWHGDTLYLGEVSLPPGFDVGLAKPDVRRSLAQWEALGVRRPGGGGLGSSDMSAAIVRPGGDDGPNLLVTENYRAIMRYNSSLYYATAVTYLAEQIRR